ncbi:FAD-binding oxidoreductase [Alteromonas sediminis]|uniref:FAD-binding oxidoreductase n=1 Tax=Alteromonas sediminis TaxID=2259342 RepID=A0A3N5YMJ5_9ALTE|nr:FAD-binding protein [Alteromonas sediminis]RPJ66641.1 FAD-binding oxidoreductase [Alteromonas sediminis]
MPAVSEILSNHFTNLPKESLLNAEQAAQKYVPNTLGESFLLSAAISLTTHEDIRQLIELAITHGFILQPVSSGNNWGYGSIAHSDEREVVLLDLANMNQITPISKELGLISVQPGVTQQQLYDYLKDNDWPYMTPVTGAGPSCSILANALERGYGITPHTDHFAAVNKITAIIPNPEFWENSAKTCLYESGVGTLDLSNEKVVDHSFKWGLGAYIDGLFTQSSMAIVTDITIRLAEKPEGFTSFYIKINDAEKLDATVRFIRDTLRDFEGIIGSINLMDKRRLLAMVAENPNGNGSHSVMTDEQIAELAKKNDVSEWMIAGSIYGQKGVVKAVKSLIRKRAGFANQTIWSDGLLIKLGKLVSNLFPFGFLKAAKEQLKALDEGIDIMLGKPQQVALPLAYWRNPRVQPDKSRIMNPATDACGLLWYAPLIPMNEEKIREFVAFIRKTTPKYKIEPLITFTNLKHDCIDSTIPIIFDLHNPEARQNAYDCLNELYEEGRKRGYVPYRMNVTQQREVLSADVMHWQIVKSIKAVFDPNNIIAPGRYNP